MQLKFVRQTERWLRFIGGFFLSIHTQFADKFLLFNQFGIEINSTTTYMAKVKASSGLTRKILQEQQMNEELITNQMKISSKKVFRVFINILLRQGRTQHCFKGGVLVLLALISMSYCQRKLSNHGLLTGAGRGRRRPLRSFLTMSNTYFYSYFFSSFSAKTKNYLLSSILTKIVQI